MSTGCAWLSQSQASLSEADQLRLGIWNHTDREYSWNTSVVEMVSRQTAATPDATALSFGDLSLTYRELDRRSNQLASLLKQLGVGTEMVVAIYLNRSISMVVAQLAILKAGGAYLPLDPACPAERVVFMLDDAGIRVVITGECLSSALPVRRQQVVILNSIGQLANDQPADLVSTKVSGDNLAYVIYTSGSTGQPKGVELTHHGLLNLTYWHQSVFEVKSTDRASQLAGLGFDAAVWEIWPYLSSGASVHLMDGIQINDPRQVRDWLISRDITITFLPTPLAEQVMTLEWPSRPALRLLLTGADTLHHYPSRKLRFQVVNNYGPTECTVVATSGPVASSPKHRDRLPTIGRPIANAKIYILDEQKKPLPIGEPGEIYIGGRGVGRGYRNRPELTQERFLPDPFSHQASARMYRTGDLARFLPDGEIAFLGRVDEQIKIRGYRIEPAEIVKALDEHPAVTASFVVAREAEHGDKQVVAYFVPAQKELPTHSELRNFLGSRVPDYMVPALFVKLNSLPLNASGKIDRMALPAPDSSNTLRDNSFVAPRTAIEARIADMLASLLGIGQVSVEDNFFLLGGHSLLGTQLIAKIRDAFGIELTLKSLFDAPTACKLAIQVESLLIARLEAISDEEAERLMGGILPAAA